MTNYELTPLSYDLKSDYSALVDLFDDQIRKLLEGRACFHVDQCFKLHVDLPTAFNSIYAIEFDGEKVRIRYEARIPLVFQLL